MITKNDFLTSLVKFGYNRQAFKLFRVGKFLANWTNYQLLPTVIFRDICINAVVTKKMSTAE